jgi:hypothetical protein
MYKKKSIKKELKEKRTHILNIIDKINGNWGCCSSIVPIPDDQGVVHIAKAAKGLFWRGGDRLSIRKWH